MTSIFYNLLHTILTLWHSTVLHVWFNYRYTVIFQVVKNGNWTDAIMFTGRLMHSLLVPAIEF